MQETDRNHQLGLVLKGLFPDVTSAASAEWPASPARKNMAERTVTAPESEKKEVASELS